jgi:hypothetical protein
MCISSCQPCLTIHSQVNSSYLASDHFPVRHRRRRPLRQRFLRSSFSLRFASEFPLFFRPHATSPPRRLVRPEARGRRAWQ